MAVKLESPIYKPKRLLHSPSCFYFDLKVVVELSAEIGAMVGSLQTGSPLNPHFANGSKLNLYLNELDRLFQL